MGRSIYLSLYIYISLSLYIYIYTYICIYVFVLSLARSGPRSLGPVWHRSLGSGVHKEGFSKGGFSNHDIIITYKLLDPLCELPTGEGRPREYCGARNAPTPHPRTSATSKLSENMPNHLSMNISLLVCLCFVISVFACLNLSMNIYQTLRSFNKCSERVSGGWAGGAKGALGGFVFGPALGRPRRLAADLLGTRFQGYWVCQNGFDERGARVLTHGRACSFRDTDNTIAVDMSVNFTDTGMSTICLVPAIISLPVFALKQRISELAAEVHVQRCTSNSNTNHSEPNSIQQNTLIGHPAIILVSVTKNTPLEKYTHRNIGFRSTRSGAG